jgi:hypothetical protein
MAGPLLLSIEEEQEEVCLGRFESFRIRIEHLLRRTYCLRYYDTHLPILVLRAPVIMNIGCQVQDFIFGMLITNYYYILLICFRVEI